MLFFSRMLGIFHRGLRYKVQVEGMKFVTSPWALAQQILTVFSQMASRFTLPQFPKKMLYGRVGVGKVHRHAAKAMNFKSGAFGCMLEDFQKDREVIPCYSHPLKSNPPYQNRNPGATYSICACCSAQEALLRSGGRIILRVVQWFRYSCDTIHKIVSICINHHEKWHTNHHHC